MGRILVGCDWDEVPHLTARAKQDLEATIPAYQRAARTKGVPALGSGAIYPIPEHDIKVDPFEIPDHWRRGFGLDVGWNFTACVHLAFDPETETRYLYSAYKRGEAEPAIHADAIRARGAWIPGEIDPAARGRNQTDGAQLIKLYRDLGLVLRAADNGVEAGIYTVWTLLEAQKLKVFASLREWFNEYRLYARDDKGKVKKKNDHLMDASRYIAVAPVNDLALPPSASTRRAFNPDRHRGTRHEGRGGRWMNR